MRPKVPYYAAIEYGSYHSVGKYRRLSFLGSPGSINYKGQVTTPRKEAPGVVGRRGRRASQVPDVFRSTDPRLGVRSPRGSDKTESDRVIHHLAKANIKASYYRDAQEFVVKIKNPVPEYRYGRDTFDKMLEEGIYEKYMIEALVKFAEMMSTRVTIGDNAPPAPPQQKKATKKRPRQANLKGNGLNKDVSVLKPGDAGYPR